MSESQFPLEFYLFVVCEFFAGAIVGASIAKKLVSALAGAALAILLGLMLIVYGQVLGHMAFGSTERLFGTILASLILLFVLWLPCLLAAFIGYWAAFIVAWKLGIGRNRITLASVFAMLTILAVVAAVARP